MLVLTSLCKMRVPNCTFLVFCVSLLFVTRTRAAPQRLIALLFDGGRWDYLDYEGLGQDGFRRVIREGVRAEYLQPDFPTVSYPNYYTLMTGLHCESHGMVGNFMYDPVRKETFLIGTNPEQYNAHWWDGGDPLWVTAVRQNKRSYMYYWLGCEVEIRGIRPTNCTIYPGHPPSLNQTRGAIDKAVDLLQENKADVIGIYFEYLDKIGHQEGPLSAPLIPYLLEYDRQVAHLLHEIESRDLRDVNVMIFSDHGTTPLSPNRTVDLTSILQKEDLLFEKTDGGVAYLWPREGKLDKVYNSIVNVSTHLSVYKKEDIPERWHYKRGGLTSPILVAADLGWTILTPVDSKYPTGIKASHGFDNAEPDMRGIFTAWGPAFRKGSKTGPLRGVDLYQVMCKILDIKASPNNGSWAKVQEIMAETGTSSAQAVSHCAAICLLVCTILIFK